MNLLELNNGIVHADSFDGMDYTLCGITAENLIDSKDEYFPEDENVEIVPVMMKTARKITCSKCARIIRYCVKLGLKSIGKEES